MMNKSNNIGAITLVLLIAVLVVGCEKKYRIAKIERQKCARCLTIIDADTIIIKLTRNELAINNRGDYYLEDTGNFAEYDYSLARSQISTLEGLIYCDSCQIMVKKAESIRLSPNQIPLEKESTVHESNDDKLTHITGIDNGYSWRRADYYAKINLCDDIARRIGKNNGSFYYNALDEFYNSNDPNILNQRISTIAGMATAMREN